jgi:hypothetical protein
MELQMQRMKRSRGRPRQSAALDRAIASIRQQIAQYRAAMVRQIMSQARAVPHWLPLLVAAMLAAAPWFKWRFSLRTLLIATALVAVGLGMVVVLR